MRRRALATLAGVGLLLGVAATPVGAIEYGQPDNGAHPFVGLVAFHDANHVPLWRCSGTLINPSLFLTAGHCTGTDGTHTPAFAVIWFSDGPEPIAPGSTSGTSCVGFTGYPCTGDASGTPHPHPDWTGALTLPDTHDIGVVVLDHPYLGTNGAFGALPGKGTLDRLATRRGLQNLTMTIVGYGVQSEKPTLISIRQRYIAQVKVVDLVSALTDGYNVRLSSNPGSTSGGTCFGDSGGPIFLNGTNVVVGVNSFVLNLNCKGSGYAHRVDIEQSLDFLANYLD
jgi:hypothetical protein